MSGEPSDHDGPAQDGTGPTAHPNEKPEGSGQKQASDEAPARTTSLSGRLGTQVARVDSFLSDGIWTRVSALGSSLSEYARRKVQSGHWQNYAFLAVVSLLVFTAMLLIVRGCAFGAAR